jgi:multiple sugar transport system ATP-binding protein
MAAVTLRGISKTYADSATAIHQLAVQDVDLEVADGECVVLLGPSGCGKTTLLRLMAGLESVTSGDIFFNGVRMNAIPPAERNVAMVFQNFALYPHLSVQENLTFGLKLRGVSQHNVAEQLRTVVCRLGLESLLQRNPAELSGGEQQRVALGRAWLRQPQLVLFDEPMSQLDAPLRAELRREIKRYQREKQQTMIYVTHDQAEALSLADRIVVMDRGRICQVGTPDELYAHPANMFVAGFVGAPAMNWIEGWLLESVRSFDSDVMRCSLADVLPSGEWRDERRVTLGIRPADLLVEIPADEFERSEGDWEATLENTEFWGDVTYGTVRLRSQRPSSTERDASMVVIGKIVNPLTVTPGIRVKLSYKREQLHLFDTVTKQRIITNYE